MAEKVQLKVDLEANLGKVVEATRSLKLDKGQTERLEKYKKGAELAYANGDLKTFQKNFNNVVKLFKEAASVTGKVSEEIKKLTDRQSALNQEINRLKDKKTSLEGKLTKDRSRITVKAAREFASTSADAKKVITGNGKIATREEIIELQKALADFLVKTGKTISQVTNEDLKSIKTSSGLTFGSRNAMFAANRYVKAEGVYEESIKTDLIDTENQIQTETNNYTELSNELNRMSLAAKEGADDISKLYAEISKLGDDTNKEITDIVNEEKINKTDRTGATQGADLKTLEKQTSSLGKAFKQFTIYSIAVRAAKTALREAVQTVKELDKYLTEQAMVTGLTRKQTYELVSSYQELALQCGATTKEIAQVATEYMKQGKTIQESLTLTQAAVSAAKVARVSVGDSVNYLTTALNGFQLSAEDAMRVSDKFAAVAASSATDYDELAIALSKVASQANLAGMSIDYTTALLTKGLETTREAPETMGTALKTIIARMRELGDYGETLEGDTDINNVESQLAYVGIALRDANGELRSTEDVLDELGKKWDTLNKNQQAALAKALAGTRQQSRLIALMDDYERVTELQEISTRSAGATAAQAGVYLEGIEASLNKIQVAWENIVMAITDSEIIIAVLDGVGNILDAIGNTLETTAGSVTVFSLIAAIGVGVLINKIAQWETQKSINRSVLEEQKTKIKTQKLEKEQLLAAKKRALELVQGLKLEKQGNKEKAKGLLLDKDKSNDLLALQEIARLEQEGLDLDKQEAALKAEIAITEAEIGQLSLQEAQTSMQIAQNGAGFASAIGNALTILTPIMSIMSLILMIQQATNNATLKGIFLKKKENNEEKKGLVTKVSGMFAKIVQAFSSGGIPGVIAGIAIATALAIGLGVAIAASMGAFSGKTEADRAAEDINNLSNEIYKLNEKANALNSIADSFDNIDGKLIKTNADLKEMNSLLDQAADKLSDEIEEDKDIGYGAGVSEKAYYEGLQSDRAKRQALDLIESKARKEANSKRTEQIQILRGLSQYELGKFLNENTTNAEILQAQDAIFALNNNELYEYIDKLKESGELTAEEASATEALTQSLLDNMSVSEAWGYAQVDNGVKVQKVVDRLKDLTIQAKNTKGELENIGVGTILTTDDYSLKEQVEAYELALQSLEELGDKAAINSFTESFIQFERFSQYEDYVLDFVDSIGLSIDELNKFYDSWETLQKKGIQISQEDWQTNFDLYLTRIAETNGDIVTATREVFGDYLDDSEDALNAFITAYGDLVEVGILNMGQNLEKLKNTVSNFYEKSLEWGSMSESEKAEFIADNADLFSDGKLLEAFESGNYEQIEEALKNNTALQKQIEQRKKEVAQELLIERSRKGDDRNEAYIATLEKYEKYLNDAENMFKASLEVRLEQEQKQLDEYRSYLEEQQSALEESLEKRKEAYEKYFDSINQTEEDEEYEDQANLLINNMSKLSSTSNASAQQQMKELEQQFKELEEERMKELRERAQEQIIENIDDELSEISDKFDKLLESNQALLAAMTGDLENPLEFIGGLLGGKIESGATALEVEDYIKTLQSTYGNVLGSGVNWEDITVKEENNQMFLTVNGQDILLDTQNEQNLYTAIMKALTEIGLR